MTSHKWRELVSSGSLVCRCRGVFLWCYLWFCFASFSSLWCRWSRGPSFNRPSICKRPDSHVCFFLFFLLFIWRCHFFRVFFVPPCSLCVESTSYVLSFRMIFFYLVTTDWGFDIIFCVRIQSINKKNVHFLRFTTSPYFLKKNLNASKPSEHPPVRGENVKTFRWDHRLQIQNLFMAFKRAPYW